MFRLNKKLPNIKIKEHVRYTQLFEYMYKTKMASNHINLERPRVALFGLV